MKLTQFARAYFVALIGSGMCASNYLQSWTYLTDLSVREISTSALYLPQQDKTSHSRHVQLPLCCQNPSEDETVPL